MIDNSKIMSYIQTLSYLLNKPQLAPMVAGDIDPHTLADAGVETKLLCFGALLATKRFEEFISLANRLDFSELSYEERENLAHAIANFLGEIIGEKPEESSELAQLTLHFLKAIVPETILAHETPCTIPEASDLIMFDYDTLSPTINGAVFFREFMFGPGTRKHEFGYRIQTALSSQGWGVPLFTTAHLEAYSSPSVRDFAIIDIEAFALQPPSTISATLDNLKKYLRKLIVIEPDPWSGINDGIFHHISHHVDYIWGFTADWKMVNDSAYSGRVIQFPNVGGFDTLSGAGIAPLNWNRCSFNFTGSVEGYNFNRMYWILECIRLNIPVSFNITCPRKDDGLDRDDSLNSYAAKLAVTHAAINFTTRKDGSRILTGRAVEVISLKRLLVQELCPAFHQYYVKGEHFLEFSTIDGLQTVLEFAATHPGTARLIAEQGYRFYHERYSSKKMVQHIQTYL